MWLRFIREVPESDWTPASGCVFNSELRSEIVLDSADQVVERILEAGWRVDRAVRLRAAAADAFDRWPWLVPPSSMGSITVVDVANAHRDNERANGVLDIDGYWARALRGIERRSACRCGALERPPDALRAWCPTR